MQFFADFVIVVLDDVFCIIDAVVIADCSFVHGIYLHFLPLSAVGAFRLIVPDVPVLIVLILYHILRNMSIVKMHNIA